MKKRWKVKPADRELQEVLGRELGILPLTAQLLVNRGLVECDKASSFLRPELKDLHDPFLLKGMREAARRVAGAVVRGEPIAVYGDYDVDGTTSSALLYLFFREIGVEVRPYIPDRHNEGYGLNAGAVRTLASEGVRLLITVDCGISNAGEVALANSLGVDVIVTDHHEPPGEPPPAFSVVNPKQEGCAFPFKGLAGVGVAFNLVMAVRAELRSSGWFSRVSEPNLKRFLDLVAIGTVADMVPLRDENRVLVSHGLKELASAQRPGLKALIDTIGLKSGVTSDTIAYQIAPRINAAGRVASARTAFDLLVTESPAEAERLSAELNRENFARQKIEEETLLEALAMIGEGGPPERGIVLSSEGWHPGVIGIVASRLVDRFSRPAVMIALNNGVGKGSARGVKSFDMLEGLRNCSALLERFGGHKAAAGLTVTEDNVEAFRRSFLDYANRAVTDDDLVPEVLLDAVVVLDEISPRLISEMESLAPYGVANREPLLCLEDANILETKVVGSRHLRFRLKCGNSSGSGIGFGLAGLHPVQGEGYGIAFSPYVDEWQGMKSLRLRIKDVARA